MKSAPVCSATERNGFATNTAGIVNAAAPRKDTTITLRRARLRLPVRRQSASDAHPPNRSPAIAPISGMLARKPSCAKLKCRPSLRYVGSHVR